MALECAQRTFLTFVLSENKMDSSTVVAFRAHHTPAVMSTDLYVILSRHVAV